MISLKVQSHKKFRRDVANHPDITAEARLRFFKLQDLFYFAFSDDPTQWHTLRDGKKIIGVAKVAQYPREPGVLSLNYLSVDPEYQIGRASCRERMLFS